MFSDEHLHSIALRRCTLVGDLNFQKLVTAAGSARDAWKGSKEILTSKDGIGRKIIAEIGNEENLKFAEKEIQFCIKNNIKILLKHAGDYPKILADCEDAPAILYLKGNLPQNSSWLSIVGTRNASSYGKSFISSLLQQIPNKNSLCIVSGLAIGTDTEAHLNALKNNIKTVGVLAHGFHTFYPPKNKRLSEEMVENGGALLTEFNSSQKPDRENFIQRNRIVAALSPATVVVETAYSGGSISTANFALNYNRDVFALPGRIWDKYSQGCNALIAQNKAAAIVSIPQLLGELSLDAAPAATGSLFSHTETRGPLSEKQKLILEKIKSKTALTLDDLAEEMDVPGHALLGDLLEMELNEWIRCNSGRQYSAW